MSAFLSVSLHNDMHELHFFKVVDNISGKTVLEDDMQEDETRTVKIAAGISGDGDISYSPRFSPTIRKPGISDGDTVDMN